MKDDLLNALLRELDMHRDFLQGIPVTTIYIGGGTPSLLSADEINRLFDFIFKHYPVNDLRECTLEANPDDLSLSYLKALKATPIDRFSIGVQSFRDSDLQYMHRAHNAQQAEYAIKAAQDTGFSNLSIDLIYGTPGLGDADWKHNLQKMAALDVPHFSAYALTVEEGTALAHAIRNKKSAPVLPEQSADQFQMLMEMAPDLGYEHYEISNFARPGRYAIHNTNYWTGVPYLGIGPSAHSFDGKSRRWNVANNALYTGGLMNERKLSYEEEQLTPVQQLNEYIMTSLRTQWGCSLYKIRNGWDSHYMKNIVYQADLFREKKWMVLTNDHLILTNTGKLYADRIAAELFADEHF